MKKRKAITTVLWYVNTHRYVAESYIINPDDYVRTFTVQINGKKRHILTYKADKKGASLRKYHELVATAIELCYESTPNSYAYKKGAGVLSCLEQHLESNTFLKTDIHEFFGSIQYDKLLDVVLENTSCRRRKHVITRALKTCFYDGHMPTGFVTSPVLSDLYLHNLDKMFLNRNDLVYSRYADDFIISGRDNMNCLEQAKGELEEALNGYGLTLNTKKTYYRKLRQPGDAIHVLGVNLVNDAPGPNRVTISDRYIRETSMYICQFLTGFREMTAEERESNLTSINGKIEFIRYFSTSSYNKLEKMVSIKCGSKIELSRNNLWSLTKC